MGEALDGGCNERHWVNETKTRNGNTAFEGWNPIEERGCGFSLRILHYCLGLRISHIRLYVSYCSRGSVIYS